MTSRIAYAFLLFLSLVPLTGCQTMAPASNRASGAVVHYLEIVTPDVAAHCDALARVHGVTFGPPNADLGQARVARMPDGRMIGVRAPLAAHEQPIVRTYIEVDDIAVAASNVEAAGGMIAYPPTKQGDTGTWAVYILNDVQMGLWQR